MENKITITPTGDQLILREGAAEKLIEAKPFKFEGNIEAPAEWVKTKPGDIDILKALAIVNKPKGSIQLQLNAGQENRRLESQINGSLEFDDKFETFQINKARRWELNDLANHLKFNRRFFVDPTMAMEVVSGLKSFKASVQREIEAAQDDRGNKRTLQDKRVNVTLPERFLLSMPFFRGDASFDFEVELCIEEKEGVVRAFLQSVEAEEKIQARLDERMDAQVKVFKDNGITVIFQ